MTTLASDTFVRANQSGWGTASDGQTWATVAGTPTLSISSNEGLAQTGAFAADAVMLLGVKTTEPINWLCRFKITDGNGGAVWRYQSAGNYYRLVCELSTAYLQKCIGGSFTTITTAAGSFGAFSWLRVVSNTTDIAVTLWADGSSEPGTPTISTSDATYTTAGQFGISDVDYGVGTANLFDSLTVTDNQSVITTTYSFTEALTGVDTIAGTLALSGTDTLTITDSLTAQVQAALVEALSVSDTAFSTLAAAFTEALTASDVLGYAPVTPTTSAIPTTLVFAQFRSGVADALFRDGIARTGGR